MGIFHRSPEERAAREQHRLSRQAVIEGRKAVKKGDFQRAEELRQQAVAHEAVAIREERIANIKKKGSLYQLAPGHVRRAERTR